MKKIFIALAVFLSLKACSPKEETSINQTYVFEDAYTCKLKETIAFPLDSVSPYYSRCVQYFEDKTDSTTYFVRQNEQKNSLYFYDYATKKLKRVLAFPEEGAKGVGMIEGFYIHTLDSIFLPSTNTQALYLVNGKGDILQKYRYNRQSTKDIMQVLFAPQTMALVNNKLYCPTPPRGKDRNTTITEVLDLKTKKWTSYTTMPKSYDKGFFGSPTFYLSLRTYNPHTQRFVLSFPIDNYVYEYDLTKQVNSHYAGSKYLKDVRPMASSKIWATFQDRHTFYRKSPSYGEIVYDQYRKMYYRIAEKPIPDEYIHDKDVLKKETKNYVIIILDEKFKKVGEFVPPVYTYGTIITPIKEGILISNFKKSRENKNEDYVYYDLLEVVEKKK